MYLFCFSEGWRTTLSNFPTSSSLPNFPTFSINDLKILIPPIGRVFELSHLTAFFFFNEIPTIIFPFLPGSAGPNKSVSDLSNDVAPATEAS